MKTFILLTSVPGAGKSTWAKNYQKEHPNVFIVSSDEVRKEVTGLYQNFDQEEKVWDTFLAKIHEYGQRHEKVTVIADAVNDTNELRKFYAQETHYFDQRILVYIKKPLEIVLQQNKMRQKEKWVPDHIIELFFDKVVQPSEEVLALYDQYIYLE